MNKSVSQEDVAMLYDLHFRQLYRFFYFKVLSRECAEDLTSETFLTFVDELNKKKEIKNLRAYLFGIAKNVFTKFLQRKYKEIPFSNFTDNFEQYILDFLEKVDTSHNLEDLAQRFIKKLPEKQRIVLHMRLVEKNTLSEISQKLGKDMNYVKTTQKRGIKSLKKMIAVER